MEDVILSRNFDSSSRRLDRASIQRERSWRAGAEARDITGDERLHDKALNRADEQCDGGFVIQRGSQFATLLALRNEPLSKAFAIALDQGVDHALGYGPLGALQLSKQHPGHAGVFRDELDMRSERSLQCFKRRGGSGSRLVDPRQQARRHPFHHGLKDGVLGGEVPEQGALRHPHPLGDGPGGDVRRVLLRRQVDDGFKTAVTSRRSSADR